MTGNMKRFFLLHMFTGLNIFPPKFVFLFILLVSTLYFCEFFHEYTIIQNKGRFEEEPAQ